MTGYKQTGIYTASRLVVVLAVVALILIAATFEIYPRSSQPKASPSVRVSQASLDAIDAPAGYSYYLLTVNASNSGTRGWKFDPALLRVISNASHSYLADDAYNVTTLLTRSELDPGKSIRGVVVFQLPAHEVPSQLVYNDTSSGVWLMFVNIPQPTSFAIIFDYNLQLAVDGIPVDTGGWTASECPTTTANGTGPWICSLSLNGVVMNGTITASSVVLFSGQVVQVNLWFEYLKKPADPSTVTLQGVAAGNGFQLVKVVGPVPQSLTGWGSQGGLTLYLKILQGQHSSRISVSEQFSA